MTTGVSVEAANTIELDWFADNDVVQVTPQNQQRFEIQKDRAIQILERANEADRFNQQFDLLLSRLAQWIKGQDRETLSEALVTLQDNSLLFVVVLSGPRYNEQLQDELAELDFEVANDPDLDLVKLRTLILPKADGESIRSFLDKRLMLSFKWPRAVRGARFLTRPRR